MGRAKEAIAVLARELKNARRRNERRGTSPFAWSISNRLTEMSFHIRRLKIEVRMLEKQEYLDKIIKREKVIHKNQNRGTTGTYGR